MSDLRTGQPVIGPLPATHPRVGAPCAYCDEPIQPGDYTTFVLVDHVLKGVAVEVHPACKRTHPSRRFRAGAIPAVAAYQKGSHYVIWCDYCRRLHHHTAEEGHRLAHCTTSNSPYIQTGYVLVYAGKW